MERWIRRGVAAFALLFALSWIGDYSVLRLRIATHHGGTGTVTVNSVDAVHLKNGKTEFYDSGPQDQPCVESLFPHLGQPTCWKLRRSAQRENDYFKSPSKF